MREIKVKAKSLNGEWVFLRLVPPENHTIELSTIRQYTGLKDKNGLTDIYEGDIIGVDGIIRGNKYENRNLLQDKTNLIVEGFGTETWCATYQEAMVRGCKDSE